MQAPGQTTTASRLNNFSLIAALDDDNTATGDLFWDDGITVDDTAENASYLTYEVTFDGTSSMTLTSVVEKDNYSEGKEIRASN